MGLLFIDAAGTQKGMTWRFVVVCGPVLRRRWCRFGEAVQILPASWCLIESVGVSQARPCAGCAPRLLGLRVSQSASQESVRPRWQVSGPGASAWSHQCRASAVCIGAAGLIWLLSLEKPVPTLEKQKAYKNSYKKQQQSKLQTPIFGNAAWTI